MPNSFYKTLVLAIHPRIAVLAVLLVVSLAGCSGSGRRSEPAPPVYVSADTWRQVDRDVGAASLAARDAAENYAHGFMAEWLSRVHALGEDEFVPWYTGYWTQQWLAIKVAWYKVGDDPVARLAAYLQEQYQERVLTPVSEEIDPKAIMAQATTLYVRLLAERLQGIPERYGVPAARFDHRLQAISAISAATPGGQHASLYQLVHSEPIADLPAYASLLERVREEGGGLDALPSETRISPLAERAAERLIERLALSGGASAAAAAVGGVAGAVLSLGAAGFGAIAHAQEVPALKGELRESLRAAENEMWQRLFEDRGSGVLAGIDHIDGQIERSLINAMRQELPSDAYGEKAVDEQRYGEQPLAEDWAGGG